jgi:excisionase family DNA binding protein
MEQRNIAVLTVEDVSKILQIGRSKTYELFRSNGFPSFYLGRQLRVYEVDFLSWLSSQGK